MGIGIGLGMPDLNWSWWLLIPLVIGVVGVGMFIMMLRSISGTRIVIVPAGEQPDVYYRKWSGMKWSRRFSRRSFFLFALFLGMALAGCGTVIVQVLS